LRKHILITGGLGFIGTHCIKQWRDMDWDITVIDNLSSNAIAPNSEEARGVRFANADIADMRGVWAAPIYPKFDLILHLASPVGPVGVLKHSGNMARIILDDIYSVIEGAKVNRCPLVFVSTSEIYGHRDCKTYLKEDDDKVLHGNFTVRNEYSAAKLLSEIVLSNTAKIDSSFKYQIIRPFNVSGAYQLPDGGFVLPRFVSQALMGEDITVYGSGEQLRAFTWVRDIVLGICQVANAPSHLWNQEWNIGNEANERTIGYLADNVKLLSDSESKIVHVDPKTLHGPLFEEAPEKIPDSTKIKTLLGWEPTFGVNDIINEVVKHYAKS
jgi:UDP-glucose 4-epimerase